MRSKGAKRHSLTGRMAFADTHSGGIQTSRGQWLSQDDRFERMVDALSPRHERVARPITLRKFSWEGND